jgi:hypothetical protein
MDDGNFGDWQREDQLAKFLGVYPSVTNTKTSRGKFYAEALQIRCFRVRPAQAQPLLKKPARYLRALETSIVSMLSSSDGAVNALSN